MQWCAIMTKMVMMSWITVWASAMITDIFRFSCRNAVSSLITSANCKNISQSASWKCFIPTPIIKLTKFSILNNPNQGHVFKTNFHSRKKVPVLQSWSSSSSDPCSASLSSSSSWQAASSPPHPLHHHYPSHFQSQL